MIQVSVHLHTILQLQTPSGPVSRLELELPVGSTLLDLMDRLDLHPDLDETLLVINGQHVGTDRVLHEGDTIHFIPAMSGGYGTYFV